MSFDACFKLIARTAEWGTYYRVSMQFCQALSKISGQSSQKVRPIYLKKNGRTDPYYNFLKGNFLRLHVFKLLIVYFIFIFSLRPNFPPDWPESFAKSWQHCQYVFFPDMVTYKYSQKTGTIMTEYGLTGSLIFLCIFPL
jgi:hypothetical protein